MKRIGIVGFSTGDNSFGLGKSYLEFISKFGIPHIIMPNEQLAPVDMVIMPGGPDMLAGDYGQDPGFKTGSPCQFRESFFRYKLDSYIEAGIPIFGICLGFQMLSSKYGSNITQNMYYHEQSRNRTDVAHEIFKYEDFMVIEELKNSFLESNGKKLLNKRKVEEAEKLTKRLGIPVNSFHHQSVMLNNLGKDLIPLCLTENNEWGSNEGPIVEAFIHRELPIAGVQFHPEDMPYDWVASCLIECLLGKRERNSFSGFNSTI